ncbi:MAG TPA: oligosaccharide flippase family protein [archaeon]|nr:oligosaccharide flippase family protein [archaeon]
MSLREILNNAAIVSGTNIFTSGLNFIFFLVCLNALGVSDFGVFSLALSVLSFETLFLDLGLGKVIVSDVSKEISEKRDSDAAGIFQGYLWFQTGMIIFAFLTLFFGAEIISSYLAKDVAGILKLVSILVVSAGIKNFFLVSFEIVSDFKRYSSLLFLEALTKLIFVVGTINYLGASVENVLFVLIASDVIVIALRLSAIPKLSKELLFMKNVKKILFVNAVRKHGKWAMWFSQVRNLESNLPIWIVTTFLGVTAAGVYSALVKVQVLVIRIFEPLETVFFPTVNKLGKFEDSRKVIMRATKYILYTSIPLVIVLMIFPEFFLGMVLGQNFVEYGNAFRILLFTVFIFILNIPMKPFFYSLKEQKSLAFVSFLILASTAILGSLLTISFGIIGIALNHVIGPLIDVFVKNRQINKITGIKYNILQSILPDKDDISLFKKIILDPSLLWSGKK